MATILLLLRFHWLELYSHAQPQVLLGTAIYHVPRKDKKGTLVKNKQSASHPSQWVPSRFSLFIVCMENADRNYTWLHTDPPMGIPHIWSIPEELHVSKYYLHSTRYFPLIFIINLELVHQTQNTSPIYEFLYLYSSDTHQITPILPLVDSFHLNTTKW